MTTPYIVPAEKLIPLVAEKLRKDAADDAEVIAHLDEIEPEIKEDAINAYVNAGSALVTRGTYKKADEFARRALAVDPQSSAALSFQQRVMTASALASRRWR